MRLKDKYLKEIRTWKWGFALSHMQEDGDVLRFYMGSCLHMFPSGKYYTPFAHSNLDDCPICKGKGTTHSKIDCPYCVNGIRPLEPWMNQDIKKSNTYTPETNTFVCHNCQGKGYTWKICTRCGGLGSHEAYQDEQFLAALEEVAALYGGWVEAGEGDPTDLYFCVPNEDYDNETYE